MKGRKRIPTALHLIRGNPSKKNLKDAADSESGFRNLAEADIPSHVKQQPEMLAIWKEISSSCPPGLFKSSDRFMLEILVFSLWIHRTAVAQLQTEELILQCKDRPRVNPLVNLASKESERLIRCLAECGMSPSSRSKVHIDTEEADTGKWRQLMAPASDGLKIGPLPSMRTGRKKPEQPA
jgi:P27 family predicted phage terminase small subunit